jgi:hypothetical protein
MIERFETSDPAGSPVSAANPSSAGSGSYGSQIGTPLSRMVVGTGTVVVVVVVVVVVGVVVVVVVVVVAGGTVVVVGLVVAELVEGSESDSVSVLPPLASPTPMAISRPTATTAAPARTPRRRAKFGSGVSATAVKIVPSALQTTSDPSTTC